MPMPANLTPGAERILRRSADFARAAGAARVEVDHLLSAILADESRGREILLGTGFTVDECGLNESVAIDDGRADFGDPEHGSLLQSVLDRAWAEAGRGQELGSEHLVLALVLVESPVSEQLRGQGVTVEEVAPHVERGGDVWGTPLAVDCELSGGSDFPADSECVVGETVVDADAVTARILDAAGNRAREALRVIEDFTRFGLDDPFLTRQLKEIRHGLVGALSGLAPADLVRARETTRDVGTRISTASEGERVSTVDVIQANFKRAEEAIRSLEEFAKLADPRAAAELEQLRYAVYTQEKGVLTVLESRGRLAGRNLYLLVSESGCRQPLEQVIRESASGGVGIVQLREKKLDDRSLLQLAHDVRRWTREADVLFVMNDRPDLAVLCEADGVHVGQEELAVHEVRRIVGPRMLVGVSTHDIEQARQAVLDGADYIGVGPTFPSGTKSFDDFPGLDFLCEVAAEIRLPWYAIGGITADNVQQVRSAGAERIAVSGAICSAESSGEAARRLG